MAKLRKKAWFPGVIFKYVQKNLITLFNIWHTFLHKSNNGVIFVKMVSQFSGRETQAKHQHIAVYWDNY